MVLETTSLATNELTAGSLVPLAPQLGTVSFPAYWLVMPSRYLNRRGVKAFSNWVENEALAHEKGTALLLDTLGCSSNAPFQEKASTLAHPLE
ncbi:hypothetical protein [Octadecabacter arcticus]|uniref:hypothetical protein n=1 Tax=Octadecabacter arcticus TaxID=53946 RepID=UPI001FDFDE90|nr:hypothetical protein [Octadecabacter arcticus]